MILDIDRRFSRGLGFWRRTWYLDHEVLSEAITRLGPTLPRLGSGRTSSSLDLSTCMAPDCLSVEISGNPLLHITSEEQQLAIGK